MRHWSCSCLLLCAIHSASPRFIHSLPEDTYAFPKFKVSFLNNLPISNETAQNWLNHGLRGGERQFLDQPWKDEGSTTPLLLKEIASSDSESSSLSADAPPDYSLEHMKMGPRDSYLCFIPKPLDLPPPPPEEEVDDNVTPAHSWSLLQPLSGTCLYHRQLWFTYSYCHNDEIRQFKALPQLQPNGEGGYKPVEDPEWESYTLGKAPPIPQPGSDLTVAEQNALATNLELARGAGSRYLVQRWGDGTLCDKTRRPREVEVQFHCSMAMSDNILFVKETKTCSYVLVINTPRLCGEPGFKSRLEVGDQHVVRCREIVDSPQSQKDAFLDVPDIDYPQKIPRHEPILSPPAEKASVPSSDDATKETIANFIRAVLGGGNKDLPIQEIGTTEDGEMVFELLADMDQIQAISLKGGANPDSAGDAGAAERLAKALKAAGFEVSTETLKTPPSKDRVIADGGGVARGEKSKSNDQKAPDDGSNQGSPGERRPEEKTFARHDEL